MVDISSLPYFTRREVADHCLVTDCWLSYFGVVYDVTSLVRSNLTNLSKPIIDAAGTDITHWFDQETRQPLTYIHAETGLTAFYCPNGRYIDIPPESPRTDAQTNFGVSWWNNSAFAVGRLSARARDVRIVNVLSGEEVTLTVCAEEPLTAIRERYRKYNAHADSYTWKYLNDNVDMDKTLEENGIGDETDECAAINIRSDDYVPAILIYFNDDLTEDNYIINDETNLSAVTV